jgi:formylglycine-generating enzyme required for sulfatase activity
VPLGSTNSWKYVTAKSCDDGDACTASDQCAAGGSDDAGCAGTSFSCDDHLACTTDACNGLGGCTNALQPGLCAIDGACYADGQTAPANACRVCAADTSPTAWTDLAEWTSCGEGMNCQSGQCVANACPPGYALIPPGTFTMGSPETEPGRTDDETQHEVTISQSFCIKTTEVMASEWFAVVGNNPSDEPCEGTCPVENVTWWDAVWYCNQRSVQEALRPCYTLAGCSGLPGYRYTFQCSEVTPVGPSCTGYRLPTEAEWEYAARAGTAAATYNGTSVSTLCETPNPVLDPIAWFCGNRPILSVQPVKGKRANAWGLYDMLGNVQEWCWDWYGAYPTGTLTDPTGTTAGTERVGRGGSWANNAYWVRSAVRAKGPPSEGGYRGGFRTIRATCGGVACPALPGRTASCNEQRECE